MITAHELKKGAFIRHDGNILKIIEHDYHMGGGKAGGLVFTKVRDMKTGRVAELKLDPHDKVEDLDVRRRTMKYLYADTETLCFMDPESFEQISISKDALAHLIPYLKEETEVEVEFYEGNPINLNPPEKVTLAVVSTPDPQKGSSDSPFKEAIIEGGAKLLVPMFIKNGDKIMVDVQTGKYMDRVKE